MFAGLKNWTVAAAGALVGGAAVILLVWAFVLPAARQEGREAERAAINEATLNAVKNRVKDDAKREQMDAYDLCVDYFRHRGRVPECDGLRSLREEQP
ncbi:MAG: hypothetical protein CMH13_11300 [Martelella sp.]|uniref:hypothetical protein n=1 Tax=Martelella sp. TaxID=1969699 RepID=UPI000C575DB5|nr:hypothetical protein [Martelella sp.]MAU21105.1 hypothetical protein [Martelella sp.]|tara:strand:+ start:1154 stop:1447 length:294 start_codon:yes stop_codon:yes gene_type:complete